MVKFFQNILVLILLIGVVDFGHSQYAIGLRGGAVISRFQFSDPITELGVQYRTHFQVAVPLQIQLNSRLYLQFEAQFIQKGVRLFFRDQVDFYDYRINTQLIEFPVLLKMNFSSWDSKLFLFGGPGMAYYMTGKYREYYSEKDEIFDIRNRVDYKGVNRWDIILQLGGEFAWTLFRDWEMFLDARYHFGFINFDYLAIGPLDEVHSRSISLSIGVKKLWEN
ncbi:MAG: PorT family protein [Saprospiraceae bacterium]|nr:PorT family protein [Saprospiraceae bacterium]